MNQSISQPINQSTNQSVKKSISHSVDQSINQSINPPINQSIITCLSSSKNCDGDLKTLRNLVGVSNRAKLRGNGSPSLNIKIRQRLIQNLHIFPSWYLKKKIQLKITQTMIYCTLYTVHCTLYVTCECM